MSRVNPFEDLSTRPAEDLSDFAPKPKAEQAKPVQKAQIDRLAQENGFPSRKAERAASPPAMGPRRRFTTGRNRQINIKATAETIDRLYRIADQKHVPLGELLQRALDALEQQDMSAR